MAKYRSVADLFRKRVQETPNLDAFQSPDGDAWKTYSWKEVDVEVRIIAAGLRSLGVEDGDRVSILCSTRIEWIFCDLGVNCAGAATTSIYPSTTPEDTQFIANDSGSVIAIVEDDEQVAKVSSQRENLPNLRHVINLTGGGSEDGWVISFEDLKNKGATRLAEKPEEIDQIIDRIDSEDLATLIYTSGTTGKPKGVQLVHDCWCYIAEAIVETGLMSSKDKQYLWLPMSHSFGKMLECVVIAIGCPTAIDGRIPKIVENLAVIRPTFMAAAPRIFEKVYNKVVTGAKAKGFPTSAIFKWAVGVGRKVSQLRQAGKEPAGLIAIQFKIADKLVFSKLRNTFGGRVRFFISGSAPLNRDIAEFFHAAGLLILEGYGLTESSAASVVNRPDHNKFGTVGIPMPGTDVKIADNGEILLKSRGIMRGYYNLPEVTAETLRDGWLHTGDVGELDADGHLRITDRIKDLIKTSGGKYVAPQMIEGNLKAICPYIGNAVVHGNRRNFCSMLITLDPEAIQPWADENEVSGDYAAIARDPKTKAMMQGFIDTLNIDLARWETIKKFAILEEDLTVENTLLTPSLKVKRKAVEAKYEDLLDSFYGDAMASV